MSSIQVEGLDEPITSTTRFTTTVRHVDKAEAKGERVTLKTSDGRIAVKPSLILKIQEIPGAAGDDDGDPEEPAEERTSPFGG